MAGRMVSSMFLLIVPMSVLDGLISLIVGCLETFRLGAWGVKISARSSISSLVVRSLASLLKSLSVASRVFLYVCEIESDKSLLYVLVSIW